VPKAKNKGTDIKIGDRIRIIGCTGNLHVYNGLTGIVVELPDYKDDLINNYDLIVVLFDLPIPSRTILGAILTKGAFYLREIELIKK